MLRAVRLAAKLNVAIHPKTAAPIPKLAPLIQNVPAARLFDEMQKLLLSGHAVETLRSLRAHGLSHGLLPLIDVILEQPLGQRFIELALADTDLRVREDRGVSPGFLFATLLWHEVLATWKAARAGGGKSIPALFEAMDTVLAEQAKKIAIPRRFEATIKEIWSLQPRFEQRSGQRPHRLLQHPRFRAGWDFLDLRCRSGELEGELADLAAWWDRFANAGTDEREAMLKPDEGPKRRSRGRGRGRKRRDDGDEAAAAAARRSCARVGMISRLRRPRQQPRASAPAARARGARHPPAAAHARRRRLAELRDGADRRRRPAARLRERGPRSQDGARPAGAAPRAPFDRAPGAAAARPRSAAQRGAHARSRSPALRARAASTCRGLTVPHPRMHQRAFVLRPLVDVAAVATIPGHGPARRLLGSVRDQRIARTRSHFAR